MYLLVVAIVGGNVEHARKPSAETCGETALEQGDILHCVGIECREETAQMVNIIQGYAVQQEEVLVRPSATHIHTAGPLVARLHTRKQLDSLEDVGLAKQNGHCFELLHRHLQCRYLRRLARIDSLGGDNHLLKQDAGAQAVVANHVALHSECVADRLVAHKGNTQKSRRLLQRQGITAVDIGSGALAATRVNHRGANQCLSSGVVDHCARHCVLGKRSPRGQQQQRQDDVSGHSSNNCESVLLKKGWIKSGAISHKGCSTKRLRCIRG